MEVCNYTRREIKKNSQLFLTRKRAGKIFSDENKELYSKQKLEGFLDAPINIDVFLKPSATPVLG
jgi:hypothetical protein